MATAQFFANRPGFHELPSYESVFGHELHLQLTFVLVMVHKRKPSANDRKRRTCGTRRLFGNPDVFPVVLTNFLVIEL